VCIHSRKIDQRVGNLPRLVSKSPSFSRRQTLVNFDIAKRRWIPSGLSQNPPLLSVARRIHFLWSSRSLSFSHVLALRSLRPRFASLADGAADHPHPLYRQFNWDQIRRKRMTAASTKRERPTQGRFVSIISARAHECSLWRWETKRNVTTLFLLSWIHSRMSLSSLFERCELAWDSRIDQGIHKATLISSDRSRREGEKNEGGRWGCYMYVCMYVCIYVCMYVYMYCTYVCMYEVSSAWRASWEISWNEKRG